MEEDLLQVGVITSTHGIKGEVKVFPTTDDNQRFKKLKECFVEYNKTLIPMEAQGARFFKNMVILKFKDIDNINDVEKYRQCKIFVDREHAVELEQDEYFVTDLIGMKVVNEQDEVLGSLTEIISTGANDVYVISQTGDKELLIPAIKDCVLNVDMSEKKMLVRLLKGMEE